MLSTHDLLTRWPTLDVPAKCARLQHAFQLATGPLAPAIAAGEAEAARAVGGLWQRDFATWGTDAGVQRVVRNRLGWLESPALMADSIGRLLAFAASIKAAGFTDVVLLGMGGSSLAPEVLRAVLGTAPGWPRLQMLDSTDPAAVCAVQIVPARTLFLLASKSGSTIEPNTLAAHFRRELETAGVARWADHFVAITDEGTALAARARAEGFRDVFINPGDIGGRYSALSFFGLVPAALMGQDIASLIGWGLAMLAACEPGPHGVHANPGAALGLAIGAAAAVKRDKLSLLLPGALEPFGLWVEQLVAESTGKEGVGVIPIAGEPLADPSSYGPDRLFVRLRIHGSFAEDMRDTDVRDLTAAGAPVAEIELPEPSALGAEFVRWEVATAVAGALLHINPFDEPNVQQAKDATRDLLDSYKAHGRIPERRPDSTLASGVTFTASTAASRGLAGLGPEALLRLIQPGDYFALLAYLGPAPDLLDELRAFRLGVHDRTRAATMFGYGPRYLHSTGQLHKGGPNTGVFVVLSATATEDLPIPGEPYSFGTLEFAQAIGDFSSLDTTGRRAVHVHLPRPDRLLIREVATAMLERILL